MMTLHLVLTMLIAGAAQAAPAGPAKADDACALLTFAEIRGVQHVAVKETKTSERTAGGQRHATCVFATEDFAHSVSLTLTTPSDRAGSIAEYWTRTFEAGREKEEREPANGRPKREEPPAREITGLGSDALWTGDGRAGSLYVLMPGGILRVSVGGIADVEERLRRSRELAGLALARWKGNDSKTPTHRARE